MAAGAGHNSGDTVIMGAARDQLKSILERVENLADEKSAIAEAMKEVYAEAKGNGFDTKTIRKIVALRGKDKAKLMEEKAILELYAVALGVDDLI